MSFRHVKRHSNPQNENGGHNGSHNHHQAFGGYLGAHHGSLGTYKGHVGSGAPLLLHG